MSAETLRRAAALMRERFEREDVDDVEEAEFYLAVADWLEYVSDQGDRAAINHRARALAVARAYVGEQS